MASTIKKLVALPRHRIDATCKYTTTTANRPPAKITEFFNESWDPFFLNTPTVQKLPAHDA